jgi:hypothetical protein
MNVEQFRWALTDLPGDMPIVVEDSKTGWMENAALYLAPAHIDRRISGNYLYAHHRDAADNCHAVLISGFGQSDEGCVEITPQPAWPKVFDAEDDVPQRCAADDHAQHIGVADLRGMRRACRDQLGGDVCRRIDGRQHRRTVARRFAVAAEEVPTTGIIVT